MMMTSRRSDEGGSPDTDAACDADHGGQKKKKKKKTTTKEVKGTEEGTEPTQQDGRNRNRSNTRLSRIRKARSVRNVYWALCPEARYEGSSSSSGGAAARLHRQHLHPLLAAAALRRVADLRGRGMAYRRRRRKGQAPVVQPAADRWDEAEGELARAIVLPPLLRSAGGGRVG